MRRHLAFALALGVAALSASASFAQDRIALVIGNNSYINLPADKQLNKAVNDARAVGDTLQRLGFKVIRGENLDRQSMIDRVFEFTRQINPGDTALMFYAGHGVALAGGNYLLPSDVRPAAPGEESRVRNMALGEADIIADIQERKARVTVLMLDACRDNPFRQPGLTRSAGADAGLARGREAEGVFTVYSAGFGQAALDSLGPTDKSPNSVFTRVLIPALGRTDAHLSEVIYDMREEVSRLAKTVNHDQFPAYYDQTRGRIFLASRAGEPARGAPIPAPIPTPVAPPQVAIVPPAPAPTQQVALAAPTDRLADLARADARNYPSKPITLIVPFAPGGSTDIMARLTAENLSKSLGQSVVVQNVTGAGGSIGAGRAKSAVADGHTLLVGTVGTQTIIPSAIKNLPFNPVTDFEPVSLIGSLPLAIMVNGQSPYRDLAGLMAAMRANPGRLNFASSGSGSLSHVACEALAKLAGGSATHIPYRGTAEVLTALSAGHVEFMCESIMVGKSMLQSGNIRALAVAGPQRVADALNVPTTAEAGVPAFQADSWIALFAPRGTPAPVTAKLNAAVFKALSDAQFMSRVAQMGGQPLAPERTTQQALRDLVRSDLARWKPFLTPL